MKERFCAIVVAAILLAAVTLPILFSAPSIPGARAGTRQTGFELMARWGPEIECQSGHSLWRLN